MREVKCISIHAPHTGCDGPSQSSRIRGMEFQSTHPTRGATNMLPPSLDRLGFQSTHPTRGATRRYDLVAPLTLYFNPRTPHGVRRDKINLTDDQAAISIHAPHTGCDSRGAAICRPSVAFQSTHPTRGATAASCTRREQRQISIHAPHTGCDDRRSFRILQGFPHFNPRTPHGVRQVTTLRVVIGTLYFNPRTPHGVRLPNHAF